MVIVGLDYGHAGQMTLDEITGGSPYGATTIRRAAVADRGAGRGAGEQLTAGAGDRGAACDATRNDDLNAAAVDGGADRGTAHRNALGAATDRRARRLGAGQYELCAAAADRAGGIEPAGTDNLAAGAPNTQNC
jgi:hypothetical protein